ncbi:MAG: DUF6134 family protein [Pseudomonadota bacterium]
MKRVILLALLAASSAQATDTIDAFEFDVFLDKKPIGYHNFELSRSGDRTVLSTEAKFDIKFLFVTAFSYFHQNKEVWSGDCLVEIEAQTDSNGKLSTLAGQQSDGGFTLASDDQSMTLDGCVQSFAYWNPSILEADKLLNAQTGEYEPVDSRFDGEETLTIGGQSIDTNRYRLTSQRGDILLWYAADGGQWLALDAPARGERRIRYEARDVPDADALQAMLRW